MSGSISNWKGFTAEDIKSRSHGNVPRKKRSRPVETNESPDKVFPVPPEARLSAINDISPDDSSSGTFIDASSTSSSSLSGNYPKSITILVAEDKSYEVLNSPFKMNDDSAANLEEDNLDKNGHACLLLEKSSLDKFEERQRLMEEQNKKRKELLTRALADRKKQTQFETKKLLQIQDELTRLDALLSNDVSILRDQIELSSQEFHEAQKHYDHIEGLFVEAKMKLFSKMERKQMLTEHLCQIIEANELRKARKLSELMTRLEITGEEGDDETLDYQESNYEKLNSNFYQIFVERPSTLDEVTHAACTTLKIPPKSNVVLPTILKEAEASDNG